MTFFDYSKSFIENAYFISSPILAFLGLFIFFQIRLAKKQLEENRSQQRLTAERNAALAAIEQCSWYNRVIIALINKANDEMKRLNFPEFPEKIQNFSFEEILTWGKNYQYKFLNMPESLLWLQGDAVNHMESFASFFTYRIGDERIAFEILGHTFCNAVRDFYPIICLLRNTKEARKDNECIVQLYKIWSERIKVNKQAIEAKNISIEVKAAMEKLNKIQSQQPGVINPIKPYGTDL